MGAPSPQFIEMRSAVRFPLRVPITILTDAGERPATTENISANGILFVVGEPLAVQDLVSFTIKMPAGAMGTAGDVIVHCEGHVVRCTPGAGGFFTAAVIDEYFFSE